MTIEIQDLQIKTLYLAAKEMERETGKGIHDIVLEIIYESEDVRAVLEAVRIYLHVTMSRDIDMDWILEDEDEDEQGDVIQLAHDNEKQESD